MKARALGSVSLLGEAKSDASFWRNELNGELLTRSLADRMEVSSFSPLKPEVNAARL